MSACFPLKIEDTLGGAIAEAKRVPVVNRTESANKAAPD